MAKKQIFLMHYAGGDCYSYRFLTPFLHDTEVHTLELSGRGRRINEPLQSNFKDVIEDTLKQIRKLLSAPSVTLYGHSLGGLLAFNVAAALEKEYKGSMKLVISGNAGPFVTRETSWHTLSSENLISKLRTLGGTPDVILDDPGMFGFYELIIRSDFRVAHEMASWGQEKINTPIYCLMGSQEEHAGRIDNWANYTTGNFRYQLVPGGHFFIYNYPKLIAQHLLSDQV
ncbi:thioesterase II family protein [Chitinophaga agri]|uniref:Thioesterase n=1 Tax=Chitinophaga agri TaxID=2703787 RepID=A0A6B9ZQM7_9BACT|nr:alpha/beta fold hydrolase [Chitinophaga agri]QHS63373.1 thioesterase [Chitinophaga agri]